MQTRTRSGFQTVRNKIEFQQQVSSTKTNWMAKTHRPESPCSKAGSTPEWILAIMATRTCRTCHGIVSLGRQKTSKPKTTASTRQLKALMWLGTILGWLAVLRSRLAPRTRRSRMAIRRTYRRSPRATTPFAMPRSSRRHRFSAGAVDANQRRDDGEAWKAARISGSKRGEPRCPISYRKFCLPRWIWRSPR